jgi:hypothetical protein
MCMADRLSLICTSRMRVSLRVAVTENALLICVVILKTKGNEVWEDRQMCHCLMKVFMKR